MKLIKFSILILLFSAFTFSLHNCQNSYESPQGIVAVVDETLDPGSPSCSCSNWGCSANGYCVDGQTCSCSCSGWFGTCSCTKCSDSRQSANLVMNNSQRTNRINLENYLRQTHHENLVEAANILSLIRNSLEEKNTLKYEKYVEEAQTLELSFSQSEKDIIQKWFEDNGFGEIKLFNIHR